MIRKKSEKQKAIENSKVPMAVQTALEDLFVKEFQMGFDFKTEIQGVNLTIKDIFLKFCEERFKCKEHTPASDYWRKCSAMPGFSDWDGLGRDITEKYKYYFERQILKTGTLKEYQYLAAAFTCVQSSKYTGKPCDIYFVELRKNGRSAGSWAVKDYPQDRTHYHPYTMIGL